MIGCIYQVGMDIKAYPNKDRLLKKYPAATILKEVTDINRLDIELRKYLGQQIKEKPKQDSLTYGTRDYFERFKFYYVGKVEPVLHLEMVPPSEIYNYRDKYFYTQDYEEYVKWYKQQLYENKKRKL